MLEFLYYKLLVVKQETKPPCPCILWTPMNPLLQFLNICALGNSHSKTASCNVTTYVQMQYDIVHHGTRSYESSPYEPKSPLFPTPSLQVQPFSPSLPVAAAQLHSLALFSKVCPLFKAQLKWEDFVMKRFQTPPFQDWFFAINLDKYLFTAFSMEAGQVLW